MPNFRHEERTKSIIQDGKELFLKQCEKCGSDFYGAKRPEVLKNPEVSEHTTRVNAQCVGFF